MDIRLNERTWRFVESIARNADELRIDVSQQKSGTQIIDCGINARGGLNAGIAVAKACLANLAQVRLTQGRREIWPSQAIEVYTDQPIAACMASQYAGWQVSSKDADDGKFFSMGSGPMRAAYGGEELFDDIGMREQADCAVGVLETSQMPPDAVCCQIAERCGVAPERLILLVARTASLAGSIQVVARSVETCLHKLHELKFDLSRVQSGYGVAPLPPVAPDDMTGIGWTNDAVLYGGEVTLWVTGDDESLNAIGSKIPSSASRDHGQPFGEIFKRYDFDFYKIDPMLFSPAVVTLVNIDTGYSQQFGYVAMEVLERSFSSAS